MKIPTPRTIAAVPVIIYSTAIFGSVAIVSSYVDKKGVVGQWCTLGWAEVLRRAAGMNLSVSGIERVDPNRTYVVVSNHQSHMDTVALYCSSPVALRMLAKDSLFRIPIFGRAMKNLGHIVIYRGKGKKTDFDRLYQQVRGLISRNHSVMVFAEGSRSQDKRMQPFKAGAFTIAHRFDLPILPVTIDGTFDILEPHTVQFHTGNVKITYHDPIETAGKSVEDLVNQTHDAIGRGLAE